MSLSPQASELISAAKEILVEHEKQKNQIKQEDIALANQLAEETKAMVRGMLKLQHNIKQAKTGNKELPIVKDAEHALENFLAPLTQAKENLTTAREEKNAVHATLSQLKKEIPDSDLIPKLQVTLTELDEKEKQLRSEYNALQDKYHIKKDTDGDSLTDKEQVRLQGWHTPIDVVDFTANEMLKLYPDPVTLEDGEPTRQRPDKRWADSSESYRRLVERNLKTDAVGQIARREVVLSETEDILADLEKIKEEWSKNMTLLRSNETKYTKVLNDTKKLIIDFQSKRNKLQNKVFRAIAPNFHSREQFITEIRTKLTESKNSYISEAKVIFDNKLNPLFDAITNKLAKEEKNTSYPAYNAFTNDFYKYGAPSGDERYGRVRHAVAEVRDEISEEFNVKHYTRTQSKVSHLEHDIDRLLGNI